MCKPSTVDELVTAIYESDQSHFEFMDSMNGGDCDCANHTAMNVIATQMGWEKENV